MRILKVKIGDDNDLGKEYSSKVIAAINTLKKYDDFEVKDFVKKNEISIEKLIKLIDGKKENAVIAGFKLLENSANQFYKANNVSVNLGHDLNILGEAIADWRNWFYHERGNW